MELHTFISKLQGLKISKELFKLDGTEDDVMAMLKAAMMQEVETFGGSYINDNEDYLRKISSWLVSPGTPGLIIFGTVGNGKTTMLNAIRNMVNILSEGDSRKCITFIDASSLARLAKNDEYQMWDYIKRPMIALDDVGVEQDSVKTYGNIVNPVVELISHRYKHRLFTIISTNLRPSEIRQRYGDRIADRMNEMMTRIIIKNETYRTQRNKS